MGGIFLKLHEYQTKEMLRGEGILLPRGKLVISPGEAQEAFRELGVKKAFLKAQVHAGARGKAGGIRLVETAKACEEEAQKLLGTVLVTPQTGPAGKPVEKLYLEEAVEAVAQYYVAISLDREAQRPSVLFSKAGGIHVEEAPVLRFYLDTRISWQPFHSRRLAAEAALEEEERLFLDAYIAKLCQLYSAWDALLLEVNPLLRNAQGAWYTADAKMEVDANALFRQPLLLAYKDPQQEDARERRARALGLEYVALEGDVACLVNGAGLAMATMDCIQAQGGQPANFLDIGGGVQEAAIQGALELLAEDPKVQGLFIHIFGGIVSCAAVARSLLAFLEKSPWGGRPLVLRLEGNRAEEARVLLEHRRELRLVEGLEEGVQSLLSWMAVRGNKGERSSA